jgi:hypothetical protein
VVGDDWLEAGDALSNCPNPGHMPGDQPTAVAERWEAARDSRYGSVDSISPYESIPSPVTSRGTGLCPITVHSRSMIRSRVTARHAPRTRLWSADLRVRWEGRDGRGQGKRSACRACRGSRSVSAP